MVHRSSDVADTVTKIGPRAAQVLRVQGTTFRLHIPILSVEEEALLFSDGWLAIVRLQPYRVDWRNPQGRWTYGPPLPLEKIEIEDREKRSHRAYLAATGGADVPTDAVWPGLAPPFHSDQRYRVLASGPRGLLLIKRVPTADHFFSIYDVVDRRGALIARLVLEVNQRILSVGTRGVYVVSTDEFGLERVHRYGTPPLP
jgi:hypothetical protein